MIILISPKELINNFKFKINMKIYNGTKSVIDLPLANGSRLIVKPKSVSNEFLPTIQFLQMIVMAYSRDDLAFIPSGPSDTAMAANVSTMPGYIANSVEEAIVRFTVVPRENQNKPVDEQKKYDTSKTKTSVVTSELKKEVAEEVSKSKEDKK